MMISSSLRWLTAACVVAAGAASAREARMRLPGKLVGNADLLELTGIGGARSGRLALGKSTGEYSRQSDRVGVMDPLFTKNHGGGAVRLAGPEIGGELSVGCRFQRAQTSIGFLSFATRRLTYSCSFSRDGKPIAASFELRDRDGLLGSADGRDAREGMFLHGSIQLRMRSLHTPDGSLLSVPHALGYVFEANGEPVGAIDINGRTKRIYAPREPGLRAAVIAASLSLATFWDPAITEAM